MKAGRGICFAFAVMPSAANDLRGVGWPWDWAGEILRFAQDFVRGGGDGPGASEESYG